jgi:hypothetical protein
MAGTDRRITPRFNLHTPASRRFASRVAHVEPHCLPLGQSGIGVQFLYSETLLVSPTTRKH